METTISCPCPPRADGTPRHETDTITLRDRLDFRSCTAIRKGIGLAYLEDPDTSPAEVLALLTEAYILYGTEAWTLVDAKGKPIEVSRAAIRAHLLDGRDMTDLSDAADGLYAKQVMLPLLAAERPSSPPTPTDGSTSAPTDSPTKIRRRSKPSSTFTTRTVGTGTITSLPVGGSSSSPSSASVA